LLNKNVDFGFDPDPDDGYIELVTTNAKAGEINYERLEKLPGKLHSFEGTIVGDFDEKSYPAPMTLDIKSVHR